MDSHLKIVEVGPRDGLQNQPEALTISQKQELIESLIAAGLRTIEVTSFVHPEAVPQLADADALFPRIIRKYGPIGLRFLGLVFNQRGYERARAAGVRSISFGVAVSDTFSRRNTQMTSVELLQNTGRLLRQAQEDGLWTRIYISTAWVCPFEGEMPLPTTMALAQRLWDMGPDEIAIADTIGHADPLAVGHLSERMGRLVGMDHLAVHLHDTQALGLANALAALQAGVRIFDTSVGGLGGCPFAPGAAGNLATEDLVFMAYKMGLGTGVDFGKLLEVVRKLENWLSRPVGGRIRPWWESHLDQEPPAAFP